MSTTTIEIIEKLKSITLLEAAELVGQMEDVFGIDTSFPGNSAFLMAEKNENEKGTQTIEEKTTFDVILEEIPSDKRVVVLRIIRNVTSLGLKEAKTLIEVLPKTIKEGISKEEAEDIKQQLDETGAKTKIQ